MTGLLSSTDNKNIQCLLEHAKKANNNIEFFKDVKKAKSGPSQREKNFK